MWSAISRAIVSRDGELERGGKGRGGPAWRGSDGPKALKAPVITLERVDRTGGPWNERNLRGGFYWHAGSFFLQFERSWKRAVFGHN